MSKQTARKNSTQPRTQGGSRPKTSRATDGKASASAQGAPYPKKPASTSGAATGAARSSASSARTGSAARQARVAPRKQSGFRLRPLDIALIVLGLAVVGGIVWSGLNVPATATVGSLPGTEARPVAIGSPAPDFTLPDTEGNTHTLSSYRGKPVVLEFMAPWCPHCQEDAPMFNTLAAQYQNVQFLAVSATDKNKDKSGPITMEDMKWFKERFEVTFPMLFDPALKSANDYGVLFYPTVYILDANGTVVSLPTGGYTWVNGNPESTRQTTLTQEELAAEIEKVAK